MSEAAAGRYQRPVPPAAAIRLDLNEAPAAAGDGVRRAVLERLAAANWRRYPDVDGGAARSAAARLYGWRAEGTLVGNGSNSLLAAAVRALLPRGGRMAVVSPSFSMYPV